MSEILFIGLISLGTLVSYLFSSANISYFFPQVTAIVVIITIILFRLNRYYFLIALGWLVNLLVFATNGVSSPMFFLIYFLLFILGFQVPFTIILSYALILIIIFSQTLTSFLSLITLSSLILVSPIIWFIKELQKNLAQEETDFQLWSSLTLRRSLNSILDSAKCLGTTRLNYDQQKLVYSIRDLTANLLNSLDRLKKDL